MDQQIVSVVGNEILFDALSAKITLDPGGSGQAFLIVEFQIYSEATHKKPYSASEDKNKRIIDLLNTGKGISTVSGVKVLAQLVNDQTQFRIEVPIDSKVPNSGSDFAELEKLFAIQLEDLKNTMNNQ